MTSNERRRTASENNRYRQSRSVYVDGSTARKLQPLPKEYERPVKKVNHAPRKNRERALYMNLRYVLFLMTALTIMGVSLTRYLTLRSSITNSVKAIARLESQLNNLKLDNDERENRIASSVNLEEVKQTAIRELGMQYAREGQIITFNSEDNDYVLQKGEIPD